MAGRRRIVQLLGVAAVYLTGGAAISVAVAVGIGLWGRVTPAAHGLARVQNGAISPESSDGPATMDWSVFQRLLPALANQDILAQVHYRGPGTTDVVTSVLRTRAPTCMIHQTGWPMRALEYRFLGPPTGRWPNNASGCAAPPWLVRKRYDTPYPGASRRQRLPFIAVVPPILVRPPIPLRPLPIGLAVDASFFGGVLFVAVAALGLGRRTLRRWRLRCPSCGYSRAGLAAGAVCPECGKRKEKSLSSAAGTSAGSTGEAGM